MKLVIHHNTLYRYSQPLLYTVQTLHLWPVSSACQTVEYWEVRTPGTLHPQPDTEGNRVHSFSLVARPEQNLRENSISAMGTVLTHGVSEFTDPPTLPHPSFYLRSTPLAEPHPRMAMWALQTVPALMAARARGELPGVADLVALASAVADKVQYRKGSTGVETTALEAFDWELGVCQDQAHVMVAVCRSIGLPARYVSGYILTAPPPGQPRLTGADASHAWVQAYIPEAGWIDFDPTNGVLPDGQHVTLAWGRDYGDVSPLRGVIVGGTGHALTVAVTVTPA